MKTAISVPDELFRSAETAARRLHVSRSQLYATALADYLNRQQPDAISGKLNEVYAGRTAKVDAPLHDAQLYSLDGEESW